MPPAYSIYPTTPLQLETRDDPKFRGPPGVSLYPPYRQTGTHGKLPFSCLLPRCLVSALTPLLLAEMLLTDQQPPFSLLSKE
jgi:hypothetical protein